jgi:hypothetical protein
MLLVLLLEVKSMTKKIVIIRDKKHMQELMNANPRNKYALKFVVDIVRGILAGGGELHVDEEQVLLKDGSRQKDLWGGNYYQKENRIEYISMINIRPEDDNYSQEIEGKAIRETVANIVIGLLGP